MTPIFLLGIGRSGTTFLMRLFASHPQIIAHEDYPLEFRPALFSLYPNHPIIKNTASGHLRFDDDEVLLYGPLRKTGAITYDHVRKIYDSIATTYGKKPAYFVEKSPIALDLNDIRSHFPSARFIVLLRDPRDVILSVRAFDRRRGFHGFTEQSGDTDEQVVLKYKEGYELLSKLATTNGIDVVRYEDIALSAERAMSAVFSSLCIESDPTVINACMIRAASMEDGRHRTTESLRASVERWRMEMPGHMKALFERHFASILSRLHYPLH
jgi:hypothetical protein